MIKVQIERKDLGDKTEIQFEYVYGVAEKGSGKGSRLVATGAFFVKKDATVEDIKRQLAKSIRDILAYKKAKETKEEIEVDPDER